MHRFLPFTFLSFIASVFGILWIVIEVNPDTKPIQFFALFSFLLFLAIWMGLGTFFYFVRTKFQRKFEPNWYFKTSFKMAFFAALFAGLSSFLVLMELLNFFNLFLVVTVVLIFAFWLYLGKKRKK